jgi:hypothetical protein
MNTIINEIRERIKANRRDEYDGNDEYENGKVVGLTIALLIIDEVEREHPVPSNAEEAAKKYADEMLAGNNRELAESGHTRHFKMGYVCFAGYEIEGAFADGMLAERERLMKEAVQGEVVHINGFPTLENVVLPSEFLRVQPGSKVKLIILK